MSANFLITTISLGEVLPKVQKVISFPYTGVSKIVKMSSPCSCAVSNTNGVAVVVTITPKEIPVHLVNKGVKKQAIEKTIDVVYTSHDEPDKEKTIILRFTAVVISK